MEPVDILERGFDAAIQALQLAQQKLYEPILASAQVLISCLEEGGKIMVCGNGGSAADAQHFAAELVGRFKVPSRRALPVLALNADSALLTAWSNDFSYDTVFSRQLEAFGRPGDILIGISTSGRSRNLVEAFKTARLNNVFSLAVLGGDGGDLLPLSDLAIVVPALDTARIQEVQILVLHLLCELVEGHFISDQFMVGERLLAPADSGVESLWRLQENASIGFALGETASMGGDLSLGINETMVRPARPQTLGGKAAVVREAKRETVNNDICHVQPAESGNLGRYDVRRAGQRTIQKKGR
jgi:phosphoheptose isomerase